MARGARREPRKGEHRLNRLRFSVIAAGVLVLSSQVAIPGQVEGRYYGASAVTLTDGSSWIRSEADTEGLFLGTIDEVLAILTDYEGSPKVFSRVEKVDVLGREPGYTVTEQRNVIRIMGLTYESTIVFKTWQERPSAGEAISSFTMLGSDGSTRSVDGSWRLEAVVVDGRRAVHVENRATMLVAPRFPLQLQIMQAFGKGDYEKSMRELGAALARSQGKDHG